MLRRVKVLPDKPEPGFYLSALGWGAVASVITFTPQRLFVTNQTTLGSSVVFGLIGAMGALVLTAVPFVWYAVWSSLRTLRLLHVLGANAIFVVGQVAAYRLQYAWQGLAISASPLRVLWPSPTQLAIAVAVDAAGAAVVFGVLHSLVFKAIRQTGVICTRCLYDLTGLDGVARCPECGTRRDLPPGSPRLARVDRVVRRIAIPLLIACVVIGAVGYGVRWAIQIVPLRRQLVALGAAECFDTFTWSRSIGADGAGYGGFVPTDMPNGFGLMVVVPAKRPDPKRAVQIYLTARHPNSKDDLPWATSPAVLCDLDEQEAARLFAGGVPASLIEEFRSHVGSVSAPNAPSAGAVVVQGIGTPIVITPRRHFPVETP